jgi:bifunctional NMN adenylyltransferase/nudix hydrolase
MFKYDVAVFIGRFQPLHLAHCEVIQEALRQASTVLVFIGSANQPRDLRNPFTFTERRSMIEKAFPTNRVVCLPLEDRKYNDAAWIQQIQKGVSLYTKDNRIALVGHDKEDGTGFYLKFFPQWDSISVGLRKNGMNSSKIRESYFNADPVIQSFSYGYVPEATVNFLKGFYNTGGYHYVMEEIAFQKEHDEMWKVNPHWFEARKAGGVRPWGIPYPVTFNTVDSVVVQSGHILLVRRRNTPGRGSWALPGGYLNKNERMLDAAVRELREETKLRVPDPVLRGSLVASRTFDDPQRSTRGRLITNAFLFHLRPELDLPKVKGADDAEKAMWWPLSQVNRTMMFEDHMDIIVNMTGLI